MYLRETLRSILGKTAVFKLTYEDFAGIFQIFEDTAPWSFLGERIFLEFKIESYELKFLPISITDEVAAKEYALRSIYGELYLDRPKPDVLIVRLNGTKKHSAWEYEKDIKVLAVGEDFFGKVEYIEGREVLLQGVHFDFRLESQVNVIYSVSGETRPGPEPIWMKDLNYTAGAYRNPTNKEFWDELPFLHTEDSYFGKGLWVSFDQKATMIRVNGNWLPVEYGWLLVYADLLVDDISEEFQAYKNMQLL